MKVRILLQIFSQQTYQRFLLVFIRLQNQPQILIVAVKLQLLLPLRQDLLPAFIQQQRRLARPVV